VKTLARGRVVKHAKWGALPSISPKIHYTEDSRRDDWLVAHDPRMLPQWTDCSGWVTQCYFAAGAGLPDPNGLDYRYLGYTGTLLDHAQKHGKVLTDVSKAKPGDSIVIGPGTGDHVVVCVESGEDPIVSTHGAEGVQIIRASVDPREPKRVCQVIA
jgi:cell wall-associated NlpC family hydrolase